jgi:hypothetical protein
MVAVSQKIIRAFSYIRESDQQLKRVKFLSDWTSYAILRGRWFDIIVLNVHAPTEEKGDDTKDSF